MLDILWICVTTSPFLLIGLRASLWMLQMCEGTVLLFWQYNRIIILTSLDFHSNNFVIVILLWGKHRLWSEKNSLQGLDHIIQAAINIQKLCFSVPVCHVTSFPWVLIYIRCSVECFRLIHEVTNWYIKYCNYDSYLFYSHILRFTRFAHSIIRKLKNFLAFPD